MVSINSNSLIDSKSSFESFIIEFKDTRESVISILKIVIEQKKMNIFKQFLNKKKVENQKAMKDFMRSKYYEFIESMYNINEGKVLAKSTDDVMNNLEETLQTFLSDFSDKYIDQLLRKQNLLNLKDEKEKLKLSYILFGYLNKAYSSIKEGQFELTIRLINTAADKFLNRIPSNSATYRRGEQSIKHLKNKITRIIEEKLTKWLVDINKEQTLIGATLFKKLKSEKERYEYVKSEFSTSEGGRDSRSGKTNTRVSKNIVDNLLLIRNTSNLNYMMNKNSLLKTSVLNQKDIVEEFDIINMVSNVNLNFLESAYSIYKKVDTDTKFIEAFLSFRKSQIQSIVNLNNEKVENVEVLNLPENNKKEKPGNTIKNYDLYFSEILGFIIIQIAVFELLPMFYSKRQFEEVMNYLIKELINNLSLEFDFLKSHNDFISLQNSIFIFLSSIERIGITQRIGIEVKSSLIEVMKEKIKNLNFILIKRYNNFFVNLLFEEKCINIEVKNQDEFIKYASQYSITLDDNSKPMTGFIYPFKLPYTKFVIEVNETFKKYVDEVFLFIQPLYTEYENIMQDVVRDFIKKINECFHTFSNFQEHDLNIILAAQICNNIRFIYKSHNFFSEYVMKKCNIKEEITFDTERAFRESSQNYEEIIYENLKKKFKHFISDLQGENWLPDKPNNSTNSYIDGMIAYISAIFIALQTLSPMYIEFCFKEAICFISKIYYEDILFNSSFLKAYNINSIDNLKNDIEALESYFNGLSLTYPGFEESLLPIKQIINIFYSKKIEQFIEKKGRIDTFFEIKIEQLCKFLLRYKNLKKAADMKGKITESEVVSMVKKLKEHYNIGSGANH